MSKSRDSCWHRFQDPSSLQKRKGYEVQGSNDFDIFRHMKTSNLRYKRSTRQSFLIEPPRPRLILYDVLRCIHNARDNTCEEAK